VLVIPIFALQCPAFLPASSARFMLSAPSACSERSRTVVKSPPRSVCCGLLAVSFLPLTSFFPQHTKPPLVSLLIPLLTQKQGEEVSLAKTLSCRRACFGCSLRNVGAPTFLIFPLIFRTFLPFTGLEHNRGEEEKSWLPDRAGTGARPAQHWGMRLGGGGVEGLAFG
jgi:hypothetical protein